MSGLATTPEAGQKFGSGIRRCEYRHPRNPSASWAMGKTLTKGKGLSRTASGSKGA